MSETNSGKPSTADCAICRSQTAEQRHVVYEDDHWVLRHSIETNLVGYLVLESRRHFLDMAEAGAAEAASFGVVLKNAVQAIRRVIEVERVYTYTLAEVVPHF
ncbi:MAG TPA: hypothetical protein V6C72_16885, partial [Chroococcales cyanobacterium]